MLPQAALSLHHRGPNDSGLFFAPKAGVGLEHRRLSVIDLSAASGYRYWLLCCLVDYEINHFQTGRKVISIPSSIVFPAKSLVTIRAFFRLNSDAASNIPRISLA